MLFGPLLDIHSEFALIIQDTVCSQPRASKMTSEESKVLEAYDASNIPVGLAYRVRGARTIWFQWRWVLHHANNSERKRAIFFREDFHNLTSSFIQLFLHQCFFLPLTFPQAFNFFCRRYFNNIFLKSRYIPNLIQTSNLILLCFNSGS